MTVLTVSWQPPTDYANRPVAILGAGVLGRRIGIVVPFLLGCFEVEI